jgi:hypothetical protein
MPPLQHIVRVRTTADLKFVHPGLMDEILVNANQLENSVQSTAACLWTTTLPFAVDPVLWRFQVPQWWRRSDGETKRNYAELGKAYTKGSDIKLATGPLVEVVLTEADWRKLAANVIEYERSRLLNVPAQLTAFDETLQRVLQPVRLIAPALVAYSAREDAINRGLVEASCDAAGHSVAAQVIVPADRLLNMAALKGLLDSIPTDGVSSYFVWTPQITEELLLAEREVFLGILKIVATLAERGIPVGHQYGNYAIAALHDMGLAATTHHLGWVDHGEPAEQQDFMMRSCRTYVPAVRHSIPFARARGAGGTFGRDEYCERYCECPFCIGAFDAGQHPLDLLLEDQPFVDKRGRSRLIPTSRAVGANTWHYLWSRQLEVAAFSSAPAVDVVRRDVERAALLLGESESRGLQRLAKELPGA